MSSLDIEQLSQRDKRALVFHLLYTAEALEYQTPLVAILAGYQHGFDCNIPDDSLMVKTAEAIITQRDELDKIYQPLLSNWRFDRLGVATRLILRFATWELLYSDVQSIIVINEAIELAKCFAEKDAYKFVNGILDEVAKKLGRTPPMTQSLPSDTPIDVD